MTAMTEDLLTILADRAAIIEVVNQYGLAIDLHDWERFHNIFANPVEVDYSSIGIPVASFQPEEMVNSARQDLSGLKATQHHTPFWSFLSSQFLPLTSFLRTVFLVLWHQR